MMANKEICKFSPQSNWICCLFRDNFYGIYHLDMPSNASLSAGGITLPKQSEETTKTMFKIQ